MSRNRTRRPARRSGRRGGSKGGLPIKNILLATVMPLALLAGGGFLLTHQLGQARADANGCYREPDQAKAALWIDASLHSQSDAQLRDYEAGFLRAWDRAPANTLFMVFSSARDVQGSLMPPVFTLCKPAANQAELAALDVPEKSDVYLTRQAKDARQAFARKARKAINQAVAPDQRAGDSPILEQVRALSFHDQFTGPRRSMVIVSDGIQNSPIARFCSHQGHLPSFTTFARRPDYRDHIAPRDLGGVQVDILMVEGFKLPQPGLEHCTTLEVRRFWTDLMRESGAKSVDLTPLRYWAG